MSSCPALFLVPLTVHKFDSVDLHTQLFTILAPPVVSSYSSGVLLSVLAARKASWKGGACPNFQPCPQYYEGQIHNVTQLIGVEGCRPTKVPVCLEPDSLMLDVVVFPFATMLSSLINLKILLSTPTIGLVVLNPPEVYLMR